MGDDTVRDIEFHCVHRGDPVELLRPLAAPALPPVVDPVIRVVMASPQDYGAHILINRGGEELGTFVVPPGHWRFAHAGHSKWTPAIADVEADDEAWLVTMLVGDESPSDRRFPMSETPCDILAAVLESDAAISVHNDALYLFLYRAGWLAERFGLPLEGPICPADPPCEGQAAAQRRPGYADFFRHDPRMPPIAEATNLEDALQPIAFPTFGNIQTRVTEPADPAKMRVLCDRIVGALTSV